MMTRVLFLFGVLFLLLSAEASAARINGYARAKAKGRIYVHRPNYKIYRGHKRRHRTFVSRLLPKSHTAKPSRSRI